MRIVQYLFIVWMSFLHQEPLEALQATSGVDESEKEAGGWWPPPDSLERSYLATVPGYSLSTWEELCTDVKDPPTFPWYNIDDATCGPQEHPLTRLELSEYAEIPSSLKRDQPSFSQTQEAHLASKQAQPSVIQIHPDISQGQQAMAQIQQSLVHPHPSLLQQPSVAQIQQISTQPQPGVSYTEVDLRGAEPYRFQPHASSTTYQSCPSDINDHLQVGFLEVFWNQPNNRTPRHLLRWFGAIYKAILEWGYYCQTLMCCPCASCYWGCCFGCLAFTDGWICRPMLMLVKNITSMVELVFQVVCNTLIHPLVKSCSLVLSKVHITHIQIHPALGRHFFHRDWE